MNRKLSTKFFVLSQILILIVGLAFLAGIYYIVNIRGVTTDKLKQYNPVTTAPKSFNLEINNPDDAILVSDKSIVISGNTTPGSTVIVTQGSNNIGLEANSKGEFSTILNLTPGVNAINITAFDALGNTKSDSRTIYQSEDKL